MKAIDAMQVICREGYDNTRWDVVKEWRQRCEFFGYDNVKMAEKSFGSGRYEGTAIYVQRYIPVDSVLFVWREEPEIESEMSLIDEPIVVIKDCEGAIIEIYELN